MKQNKGFTLAELLGVIAVLAIIILITVPFVNRYIDNSRNKSYETTMKTLKKASEGYILKNASTLAWVNDVYALNLTELKNSEFIANEDIYNPKNPKELLDGCMMIIRSNSKYYYEYSDTCTINANNYTNGTAIYFNPEKGTKCTQSESVSITGEKTGCLKWYTFGDTGSTNSKINLILDHNTTSAVAWSSSATNVNGPDKAIEQLKIDTESWIGVDIRNDIYSYTNGSKTYNINYNGLRARLITANEISSITSNSTFNESTSLDSEWFFLDTNTKTGVSTTLGSSPYSWLFSYTNICTNYGCHVSDSSNSGYWTSTAINNITTGAWTIYLQGHLCNRNITSNIYGIRPVITVSKYTIK